MACHRAFLVCIDVSVGATYFKFSDVSCVRIQMRSKNPGLLCYVYMNFYAQKLGSAWHSSQRCMQPVSLPIPAGQVSDCTYMPSLADRQSKALWQANVAGICRDSESGIVRSYSSVFSFALYVFRKSMQYTGVTLLFDR